MTDSLVALFDAKRPAAFADWPPARFAKTDARLFMLDAFLTPRECELLAAHLDTLPLENEPPFMMRGRLCRMRRAIGFFASGIAGYAYSGQVTRACPLTPELCAVLRLVERAVGKPTGYNGILINRYKNGAQYISPHSDNERDLSPAAGVVCLSIGAARTMDFRTCAEPFETEHVVVRGGSLMCMHGAAFQSTFTHGIKALGKRAPAAGVRYSLTLRVHKK